MEHAEADKLGDHVEARVTQYVHRARRQVLEIFGSESAHEHVAMTLQLASMMVNLEGAEIVAIATARAGKNKKSEEA